MRTLSLAAGLILGAVGAPTAAHAQALRPNILVIFDTSGSMAYNDWPDQRLDGSPICGNLGRDRRIYVLKTAFAGALAQVGTDEVNFGLATFPQIAVPSMTPVCPSGRYTSTDAETGIANGSGGVISGCRVSTQNLTTPETTFGNWFRNGLRQTIVVDVTAPFNPAAGPGAANFDPVGGNVTELHRWIDLEEESNGVTMTNPEVRAGPQGAGSSGLPAGNTGAWGTPLGRSLLYSRLYFDNFIKPSDPKGSCRQNVVILVTDGLESCDPLPSAMNPTPAINATTCVSTGTPAYPALHPVMQACQLFRTSNVKTYVLTDSTLVAGNNPVAAAGGTTSAIGVDLTNSDAIKSALIGIIAETVPPSEICDGLDNDCDGQTDELPLPGVGSDCDCGGTVTAQQAGRGDCSLGSNVCTGTGGIMCQGCVGPKTELCNNKDDNCNTLVDENFNKGEACDNGQVGVCRRVGSTVCSANGTGVMCDVVPVAPTPEICNGLDDDCNGQTDDGVLPGVGGVCGVELGVCRAGKFKCEMGRLLCDQMMSMGSAEICDAMDNNCNGATDEGLGGAVCACAPHSLETLMRGECRPGALVCKGREPLDCEGCLPPRPEACDSKDNNCDGLTDEGEDLCVAGRVCLKGSCVLLCQSGEFPCPVGYGCDTSSKPDICRSLKCLNVECAPGLRCDEGDGQCKDPCAGVTCTAPKMCRDGVCGDCRSIPGLCATGELCLEGTCQLDPCAGKTCGDGEFCVKGECIENCDGKCATGQRCVVGQCLNDACASVPACGNGQVCDPSNGQCKINLCGLRPCPGQKCVPLTGECIDDPCLSTKCPNACDGSGCPEGCQKCSITNDGAPQCVAQVSCQFITETKNIKTSGGGGCACALPGAPASNSSPSWAILAIVAVGLLRTRRRRRHQDSLR